MRRRKKEAKTAGREKKMVLRDYAVPQVAKAYFSIVWLTIKANNFHFQLDLINFVAQNPF